MATITRLVDGIKIVDGPSREQLFDALRLFDEHRSMTFELEIASRDYRRRPRRYSLSADVMGIAPEDGSGHRWILKLRFQDEPGLGIVFTNHHPVDAYCQDSSPRQGSITDATPDAERLRVDRTGRVFKGSRLVAEVTLPIAV